MPNDNIAAISTALSASGVAVIRISGDTPLSIAEKMFVPSGKTQVKDFKPNMIGYLPQQTEMQKDFPATVSEIVL